MCCSLLKIPPFLAKIEEKDGFEKLTLFLPSLNLPFCIRLDYTKVCPRIWRQFDYKIVEEYKNHKKNEEYVYEKR